MRFALIIPAHNEEAVIARCLRTALADAPNPDDIEIIVAANGCTDRTVDIARQVVAQARVIDLPEGSKTAAINAANRVATSFPRIYLDADVECKFHSLDALARALRDPNTMVVAPAIKLELTHGNWLIRSYYSAWMKQPFAKAGKGGAGCYGLSQAALQHIGEFPPIIGDDIWIHTRFPDTQRRLVECDDSGRAVYSIVRPPSTAWQQVMVEARRSHGNAEVKRDYPSPHVQSVNEGGGVLGSLRSGASPKELAVFYGVKAFVRFEKWRSGRGGNATKWTRDLSSRISDIGIER